MTEWWRCQDEYEYECVCDEVSREPDSRDAGKGDLLLQHVQITKYIIILYVAGDRLIGHD